MYVVPYSRIPTLAPIAEVIARFMLPKGASQAIL